MNLQISTIILILVAFAMLLIFIDVIVMHHHMKKLTSKMDDVCSFMYQTMRRTDETKETSIDISKDVNKVNETVTSLTSSIRSLVKQNQQKANEKIYPGPQLLELIDKTITENILMQARLIEKQRVPNDPLIAVAEIVAHTFPHVNEKYISDRCIYIMEEYNRSQTGQRAQ